MKKCKFCGALMDEDAIFCQSCGANQNVPGATDRGPELDSNVIASDKNGSLVGWTILGFIIPLAALILYVLWKDSEPEKALAAGKGGLMSICFGTPVIGLVVFIVAKDKYPDIAMACGVCALISFVLAILLSILFTVIYVIAIIGMASAAGGEMAALLPMLLV